VGACERGNEISGFKKCVEFLEQQIICSFSRKTTLYGVS